MKLDIISPHRLDRTASRTSAWFGRYTRWGNHQFAPRTHPASNSHIANFGSVRSLQNPTFNAHPAFRENNSAG